MISKYLQMTDATKADPEHIDLAYNHLQKYCNDNKLDIIDFVNDSNNIPVAANYVHKQLSFPIKLIMSERKLESLIEKNIDFIRNKAKELNEKKL